MHSHAKPTHKLFIWAVLITLVFACVELFGGLYAHSLALLGDSGHMFSDCLALGIAGFAAWVAQKPPSKKHSFGLGRAEVIAAWASSVLMILVTFWIVFEAMERIAHPPAVAGGVVTIIAAIGFLANALVAYILSRGSHTLNTKAALLHVMGDLLGSLAAMISGLVIYVSGWHMIDPILSLFIAALILLSSVKLFRDSLCVLMEGVPRHLDAEEVATHICDCRGVDTIHDLHIWTLSSGLVALSAHVQIQDMHQWDSILSQIKLSLRDKFRIEHITLQPETRGQTGCDTHETFCSHTQDSKTDFGHCHHH